MRINNNIPALNAHRLLSNNTNKSSKVLERLSSGKKINRAADDAAGMAISEKMKAQVRGLRKASQNTLDGISLIQTAEGAMNEVHSMLQRMRELAVQSANGTVTDEDRSAIQDEVNQLTSEVNRIANGTEFNTRNLLRGNQAENTNTTVHRMSTGEPAVLITENISGDLGDDLNGDNLSIWIDGEERSVTMTKLQGEHNTGEELKNAINDAIGDRGQAIFTNNGTLEIKSTSIGGTSEVKVTGSSRVMNVLFDDEDDRVERGEAENDIDKAVGTFYFNDMPEAGSTLTIGNEKIEFYNSAEAPYTGSNRPIDINNKDIKGIVESITDLDFEGVEMKVDDDVEERLVITATEEYAGFKGQAIFLEGTPDEFVTNLQIGPNQGQGFRLSVGDIRATKLGISHTDPLGNPGVRGAAFLEVQDVTDGLSEATIEHALDVSTEERATAAITVYDNAIVNVAELRGALGAIQNRLEYTAANLDNTTENLTAALSRIEDADMALEMSEHTKLNVLMQAGTSMLAQANQRPQTILQLLNA
ncbi:flagellin [Serpentinicella sp. ANB-PHB4]|uniref:flagellin N-terminal helical domain-containing protein n=1 Tax=Serpentinicella sp. ANB-PHB4 TaxID=3074076 RepID=UPI002857645D|nr:flagellin [Serpentinicella sp. ANB-PHB4]MDR5659805.1 flagellin [Serpentinicella sp. ANB-PHB4]